MRYRIRHITRYDYADMVTLSQNVAHLSPRPIARQQIISQQLDIDPVPVASRRAIDYFGNPCDFFTINVPHRFLVVTSSCELSVGSPPPVDPAGTPPWDGPLVQGGGDDPEAWEYRYDSTAIPCSAECRRYIGGSAIPGLPVLQLGLELNRRINSEFAYDPAATSVATPVLDVLELRRGVCQDFAHMLIACLRTLGIAARYVSGYLETTPPPGRARLVGADATHAWAQIWCGPGVGWIDLDPTNDCIPGERHISIAHGRDFTDVSPLKGMVLGGGTHDVTVGVDVERIPEPMDGQGQIQFQHQVL